MGANPCSAIRKFRIYGEWQTFTGSQKPKFLSSLIMTAVRHIPHTPLAVKRRTKRLLFMNAVFFLSPLDLIPLPASFKTESSGFGRGVSAAGFEKKPLCTPTGQARCFSSLRLLISIKPSMKKSQVPIAFSIVPKKQK